jgi:2-succinyl-5-enolpyruvyl-6-hydroxy-3-cyclohexene-1-carboxylate synthase
MWQNLHNFRKQKHHQFLQNCEWSDFLAYNTIFNNLPSKSHIHLGNSTPARYAQLFDYPENYTWLSNRGTSGIDGSTSTAVGYAIKNEQFTILISGDLSFYYDANALWNNYLNRKLRIIVFNNQGGNIFRYIPGPDSTTELDMYFEAVQSGRTAGHLANMYQIPYFSAHNQTELNSVIKSFFELSEKPAILEIFTPRLIDATVLREYFKFLNK